ncbi:MAG: Sip1-related alpha-galactosidase [Planctomycetota bacterium]
MRRKLQIIVISVLSLLHGTVSAYGKWEPVWADYIAEGNKQPITEKIEFAKLGPGGVKILEDYSSQPNKFGMLKRYELILPEFSRGCYFSGDHHREVEWPDGANRIQPWIFDSLKQLGSNNYPRRPSNYPRVREGLFLLLKLRTGQYLAITPIAGPVTMTWLYIGEDGRLVLNFGTLGTEPVSCDAPLFSWCYSDDIYDACRKAWALAITCKGVAGSTDFRRNKKYPEVFKYLGWCSWENYWWEISEKLLVNVVKQIESSGLPIRYLLVDDGHLDAGRDRKLRSFDPNESKFPNGWGPLLKLRKDDKIKWMGLWHTISGYWETISPRNRFGKEINQHLVSIEKTDALVPRNNPESTKIFYNAQIGAAKEDGFDFVKVDCQARNICWYIGTDNAVEATNNNLQGLEFAVKNNVDGIINCMAHSLPCIFNTRYSAVTRCSIDYRVGKIARGKSHLLQSYSNTLWLGQTVWGDHDMFHSTDPSAGRIMAVSKAMSGGPVYLSDNPKDFIAEYIQPLCYEDGELLRPLAPAAPLPDSVFINPMREMLAYRVIAPLPGGAAAVVAYNLYHPTPDAPIRTAVTAEDYTHAASMMQPYPGKWKVPEEGLVVYDWYARKAEKLGKKYTFELKGFSDRLLHLCPIQKGWAIIGRTDKYLSPAAAEVVSVSATYLKLRMVESGPLAIWTASGVPSAQDVSFENKGNGLWKAHIDPGHRDMLITVTRADVVP